MFIPFSILKETSFIDKELACGYLNLTFLNSIELISLTFVLETSSVFTYERNTLVSFTYIPISFNLGKILISDINAAFNCCEALTNDAISPTPTFLLKYEITKYANTITISNTSISDFVASRKNNFILLFLIISNLSIAVSLYFSLKKSVLSKTLFSAIKVLL